MYQAVLERPSTPECVAPFDMLFVPQSKDYIPMPHICDAEIEHILTDWRNFGVDESADTCGYWKIAIAHKDYQVTSISCIMRIPRSAVV